MAKKKASGDVLEAGLSGEGAARSPLAITVRLVALAEEKSVRGGGAVTGIFFACASGEGGIGVTALFAL